MNNEKKDKVFQHVTDALESHTEELVEHFDTLDELEFKEFETNIKVKIDPVYGKIQKVSAIITSRMDQKTIVTTQTKDLI